MAGLVILKRERIFNRGKNCGRVSYPEEREKYLTGVRIVAGLVILKKERGVFNRGKELW